LNIFWAVFFAIGAFSGFFDGNLKKQLKKKKKTGPSGIRTQGLKYFLHPSQQCNN
jgi:hypothetical protein